MPVSVLREELIELGHTTILFAQTKVGLGVFVAGLAVVPVVDGAEVAALFFGTTLVLRLPFFEYPTMRRSFWVFW